MLTLGQAFIAKPQLLMIDELSLGLAPVIVEQLLEIVRAIHANGTTVVLVEQSVNVAITLADRAVFMEKGEVRFDGPTAELLDRPDILRAVFLKGAAPRRSGNGKVAAPTATARRSSRPASTAATSTRSCSRSASSSVRFGGVLAVSDVDLRVRQGQVLGIIGPNGAGQDDAVRPHLGLRHAVAEAGSCSAVRTSPTLPPDGRRRMGLGRSFQDARLFPSMTVRQTIAVALRAPHHRSATRSRPALMSPAVRRRRAWRRRRRSTS